jgi:hypothetical protein
MNGNEIVVLKGRQKTDGAPNGTIEQLTDEIKRIRRDNRWWVYKNDRPICGAKTRNGGYCMKSPVAARNRCRLHGGRSPRGIASPHFKDGKYTIELGGELSRRYQQALGDEKLLELRDEIALLEARIAELLKRVDTGESGATWRLIRTTYNNLRKAASANDQQKFAEELNELGRLITKGHSDYTTWDDIFKSVTVKRKLAESERKHLVETKQMMTAEEAYATLSFVVSVIKEEVSDQQALARISQKISAYVAGKNRV